MSNNEEHNQIADLVQDIRKISSDLHIEHTNGDKKLNKRLAFLNEKATELQKTFTRHASNTSDVDDKLKKYYIYNRLTWTLATAILLWFFNEFMVK